MTSLLGFGTSEGGAVSDWKPVRGADAMDGLEPCVFELAAEVLCVATSSLPGDAAGSPEDTMLLLDAGAAEALAPGEAACDESDAAGAEVPAAAPAGVPIDDTGAPGGPAIT